MSNICQNSGSESSCGYVLREDFSRMLQYINYVICICVRKIELKQLNSRRTIRTMDNRVSLATTKQRLSHRDKGQLVIKSAQPIKRDTSFYLPVSYPILEPPLQPRLYLGNQSQCPWWRHDMLTSLTVWTLRTGLC